LDGILYLIKSLTSQTTNKLTFIFLANSFIKTTQIHLIQIQPFDIQFQIFILSGVEESLVQLKVYDLLGNEIVILFNEEIPVGRYEVDFNASSFASGTYYYRIRSNDFVRTKKMIFMK
jgi:hypothetical protein